MRNRWTGLACLLACAPAAPGAYYKIHTHSEIARVAFAHAPEFGKLVEDFGQLMRTKFPSAASPLPEHVSIDLRGAYAALATPAKIAEFLAAELPERKVGHTVKAVWDQGAQGPAKIRVVDLIRLGAAMEDHLNVAWPCHLDPWARPRGHFHNPQGGLSPTLKAFGFVETPRWARGEDDNSYSYPFALDRFTSACMAKDPIRAQQHFGEFLLLVGHLSHLIQDMHQPEHTRNDGHSTCLGLDGSPMEDYVDARCIAMFGFEEILGAKYSEDLERRVRSGGFLSGIHGYAELIEASARYSSFNFLSEGTTDTVLRSDTHPNKHDVERRRVRRFFWLDQVLGITRGAETWAVYSNRAANRGTLLGHVWKEGYLAPWLGSIASPRVLSELAPVLLREAVYRNVELLELLASLGSEIRLTPLQPGLFSPVKSRGYFVVKNDSKTHRTAEISASYFESSSGTRLELERKSVELPPEREAVIDHNYLAEVLGQTNGGAGPGVLVFVCRVKVTGKDEVLSQRAAAISHLISAADLETRKLLITHDLATPGSVTYELDGVFEFPLQITSYPYDWAKRDNKRFEIEYQNEKYTCRIGFEGKEPVAVHKITLSDYLDVARGRQRQLKRPFGPPPRAVLSCTGPNPPVPQNVALAAINETGGWGLVAGYGYACPVFGFAFGVRTKRYPFKAMTRSEFLALPPGMRNVLAIPLRQ